MIIRKRPREKFLRRIPRYWSDLRAHRRVVMERRKAQVRAALSSLERAEQAHDKHPRSESPGIDMARTFTLTEAESLLPVLESLLRYAIECKNLIV